MRVLVTGGAGFIGSHYVRTLLTGGFDGLDVERVTVYDKLTYAGNLANLSPVDDDERYRFVLGDIADAATLDETLPGHDLVVNFAAETHVDRSITGAADFVVTNVLGTQILLEACLRHAVPRVLHVSTDEVYGSIEEGSWTEQSILLPNSPYSAAKAGADMLARSYARTYGLNVSVTRCSNNYGPYQFPEKLVPLFVTNLLDGATVPMYGDGLNVRDWLFVDDHCRGIQIAIDKGEPGEVYNIGGGLELTNREMTQRMLDLLGLGWDRVVPVEDRKGHDRRYSVDDSRLRGLGYAPRTPFGEGLAATVAWYRDNRPWWEPLKVKAALA